MLSKLKINAESQRVGSENGKGGGSGKRLVNVNRLESKNARRNIEGGSKSGSPRLSSVEDVMKKSPKSLTLDRDSQVKSKMKEKIEKKKSHDKRKEDHKKKLFKILKIILVCAVTAAIVYVLYFMFFKKRKKKAIEKGSKKLSRRKFRELERELAAMLDIPYENPLKARLAIIKIYHQILRMSA